MNDEIIQKIDLIAVGGRKKLDPAEVILLHADINYTHIFLANGDKIIVSYTLKKLADRFSKLDFFIRPNKSFLLNLNFIKNFNDSTIQIIDYSILMSRRKKQFLFEKMKHTDMCFAEKA